MIETDRILNFRIQLPSWARPTSGNTIISTEEPGKKKKIRNSPIKFVSDVIPPEEPSGLSLQQIIEANRRSNPRHVVTFIDMSAPRDKD